MDNYLSILVSFEKKMLLLRNWRREKGGLADSCTGVEQKLFPNESTALPKKRREEKHSGKGD